MEALSALSRAVSAIFGIAALMAWGIPSGSSELILARIAGISMLCVAVIPFRWRSSMGGRLFVIAIGASLFCAEGYFIYRALGGRWGPDYGAIILHILALAMFAIVATEPGRLRPRPKHVDG
jgi:hypothetical protein